MRAKASVTVSEETLRQLQQVARTGESRSEVVERLLREGLLDRARAAYARELASINRHADVLNREALDVLDYQRPL